VRILVTGCAGFIGYHFCERCIADGHDVVGMDNLSSGQQNNVDDLERHERLKFVRQDISESFDVDGPLDLIFNFACPASPVDFATMPLEILAVCSQGVLNLLELARRKDAVFVQASTSEVYGNPREHPQRETYWGHVNPIGPRSCYDEGKRFAEALTVAYREQYGVKARIVRIFNTYGPRMRVDDGRALPTFIDQALRGAPITIHGDGSQTRSFCFVSDLVEGIWRLSQSGVTDPVNIGNRDEITIRQLAEEIIEIVGSGSTLEFVERPGDDPQVRQPDIGRAVERLGWHPIVERRDGLALTVDWFRVQRAC
jgi:dTDP-glucose 4,6-dehydratase